MSNPATQFSAERQPETPGGRPKGSKSFTTKVREALEKLYDGTETTAERALVEAILKNAISKGDVQAQRMIWSYLDGMPQQKIDHTSDGKPLFNQEQKELSDKVIGSFLGDQPDTQ